MKVHMAWARDGAEGTTIRPLHMNGCARCIALVFSLGQSLMEKDLGCCTD